VREMIGQDSGYQRIKAGKAARHAKFRPDPARHNTDYLKGKNMNLRPLYDRIVVKRTEELETTRNGIFIPDSAKERPQEGVVIAVGHGKRLDDGKLVALDVKAGDRILFGKYAGSESKLGGTDYIVMREEDVLGILDGAAAMPAQLAG
jgi:chaperonin GroES